jgi:hypothetical protein
MHALAVGDARLTSALTEGTSSFSIELNTSVHVLVMLLLERRTPTSFQLYSYLLGKVTLRRPPLGSLDKGCRPLLDDTSKSTDDHRLEAGERSS